MPEDFPRWEREQRDHDIEHLSDEEWDAAHGNPDKGILVAAAGSLLLWGAAYAIVRFI
jgi:hypothetical protein